MPARNVTSALRAVFALWRWWSCAGRISSPPQPKRGTSLLSARIGMEEGCTTIKGRLGRGRGTKKAFPPPFYLCSIAFSSQERGRAGLGLYWRPLLARGAGYELFVNKAQDPREGCDRCTMGGEGQVGGNCPTAAASRGGREHELHSELGHPPRWGLGGSRTTPADHEAPPAASTRLWTVQACCLPVKLCRSLSFRPVLGNSALPPA